MREIGPSCRGARAGRRAVCRLPGQGAGHARPPRNSASNRARASRGRSGFHLSAIPAQRGGPGTGPRGAEGLKARVNDGSVDAMPDPSTPPGPRFGIGSIVRHPHFGSGRILAYEGDGYLMLFRGGETKRIPFSFEPLQAEAIVGDAESDRLKIAIREVLQDHGWLDVDLELGRRWVGGTVKLIPGKEGTQTKEIPVEVLFKKILSIRDKLRVLEQKINSHPVLTPEDKLDLDGYITRCYGSLTTFNVLFAAKESQFKGQADRE